MTSSKSIAGQLGRSARRRTRRTASSTAPATQPITTITITMVIVIITASGAASANWSPTRVIAASPHSTLALALTLLCEVPLYLCLLRVCQISRVAIAGCAVVANLTTWTLGFLVLQPALRSVLSRTGSTLTVEIMAIVVEAGLLGAVARTRDRLAWSQLGAAAALANATSFILGWLVLRG